MRDWMIPALLILVLLVFGSKRLPEMAQSLGQSLRILRRESTSAKEPDSDTGPGSPAAPAAPDPRAQGAVPPGQLAPVQLAPGQLAPVQSASGQLASGQLASGQLAPGPLVSGAAQPIVQPIAQPALPHQAPAAGVDGREQPER
ncbi:MAG: hypothetical protein AUI14_20230 [Actinobacteria bacterium 13_2_20CM_2_71_6]|nr:MAG: hypothetical protein AUI14_20230 [Actinobacteria bacterium 13_2_20CM_2_71_6]